LTAPELENHCDHLDRGSKRADGSERCIVEGLFRKLEKADPPFLGSD
jgi:hypothetical protein